MATHVTHGGAVSKPPKEHGHGHPPPFAQLPTPADVTEAVTALDVFAATVDAVVAEAASALDAFDATAVAGGAVISADVVEAAAAADLADAVSIVAADAIEPANAFDEADAAVGAQVLFGTVAEAADAIDRLDVDVLGRWAYAARYYRPPAPVVGVGYGVLPRLVGEAHGTVGVAGAGAVVLPISGIMGEVGDDDEFELLALLLLAA